MPFNLHYEHDSGTNLYNGESLEDPKFGSPCKQLNGWPGDLEFPSWAIVVRDVPWNWLWYPPCARDFSFQRHPLVNHVSNFRNSPPCYVYITYVYLAILGGVEETCFVTNGEKFYQFLTRMYPFIQRIKYFRIDIYLFIYLFI